jgi:hypothetical protein
MRTPIAAFHRLYAVKMLAKDPSYKYDPSNVPSLDELLSGATAPAKRTANAAIRSAPGRMSSGRA